MLLNSNTTSALVMITNALERCFILKFAIWGVRTQNTDAFRVHSQYEPFETASSNLPQNSDFSYRFDRI